MTVVNACSSSLELHFGITDIFEYLTMLYGAISVVPDVKKICLCDPDEKAVCNGNKSFGSGIDDYTSMEIQLYVEVNLKLSTTITSIYIAAVYRDYYGPQEYCNGIISYVGSFSLHQHLKVGFGFKRTAYIYDIELPRLLEQSPQLMSLDLEGFYSIEATNLLYDTRLLLLTVLKMKLTCCETNLLQYLMSRLNNLQNIRLTMYQLLSCQALTELEDEYRLEEFSRYAEAIKQHHICYTYKDKQLCQHNTNNDCIYEDHLPSSNESTILDSLYDEPNNYDGPYTM